MELGCVVLENVKQQNTTKLILKTASLLFLSKERNKESSERKIITKSKEVEGKERRTIF